MIIRPIYPKQIFQEPFYRGLWTGTLIVGGIFWMFNIHLYFEMVIFFAGVVIYRYYLAGMQDGTNKNNKKSK